LPAIADAGRTPLTLTEGCTGCCTDPMRLPVGAAS